MRLRKRLRLTQVSSLARRYVAVGSWCAVWREEGGQFLEGGKMKVDRLALNVFKVYLNTEESEQVKVISLCDGISYEQAFANAVETGLHTEQKVAEGKE